VKKDAVDDALDRLVDRRVLDDEFAALPPELQPSLLSVPRSDLRASGRTGGRPGEGPLVDNPVARTSALSCTAPASGDILTTTRRQIGLLAIPLKAQLRQRRRPHGLHTTVLPAARRLCDLPRHHHQRGSSTGITCAATAQRCGVGAPRPEYSKLVAHPA